jgi:hypothetical protein
MKYVTRTCKRNQNEELITEVFSTYSGKIDPVSVDTKQTYSICNRTDKKHKASLYFQVVVKYHANLRYPAFQNRYRILMERRLGDAKSRLSVLRNIYILLHFIRYIATNSILYFLYTYTNNINVSPILQ